MFTRRLQRVSYTGGASVSPMSFTTAFPGGGGQAATDVSPFDKDLTASATDTGCVRISSDGMATSYLHSLGLNHTRARQADGVKFSRIVKGRLFMTCGDGTAAASGVYVAENVDSPATATAWKRLDGVASPTTLVFNGGNNTNLSPSQGAPSGIYPRHYGRTIEIDETTVPGYTFIHVATVTDGAWRIKMRNSDLTAVEQLQYSGTAGIYIKCLQMACYAPNDSANNYSRIILSTYDSNSPIKPRLCTNANDTAASPTLSTTTITGAPSNVEAMAYIQASTVGAQAVTVVCAAGYVGFSINAFSASAGAIGLTNVAAASGAPSIGQNWFSGGVTNNGATCVLLVGTWDIDTVWRGTWNAASVTPWTDVVWTVQSGVNAWTEQILGQAGAAHRYWLPGANTPGQNNTAAVSAFSTAKTDPSRLFASSRGITYVSNDYGVTWSPTRIFGSADHSSVYWFRGSGRTSIMTTTCGDWPLARTLDAFSSEGLGILDATLSHPLNTNISFEDMKTGECFIGGGATSGTTSPPVSDANSLFGLSYARLISSTASSSTDLTDYNLNTGAGASTAVGQPSCGVCVYNNGGAGSTRTLIVGTQGAKGMWWTNDNGVAWHQVMAASDTVDPFTTATSYENAQMWADQSRNVVYVMDRSTSRVWRVTISGTGTVSTATCIFMDSWAYTVGKDGCGYIDIDTANNRLWIATANGVWYMDNASTAPNNVGTANATDTTFAAKYPGEIPGPMAWLPYDGSVVVGTIGMSGTANNNIYPLNGCEGPRFLHVTNPTLAASWAPGVAEDWASVYDRGYRLGFQAPHGMARNYDGTVIAVTQQGSGVGLWKVQ